MPSPAPRRPPAQLFVPLVSVLLAVGLAGAGCASDASAWPQGSRSAVSAPPAPVAMGAQPAGVAEPAASDAALRRLIDAHIEFLASDDLGGRETGTVQSLITAQYVAAAFRAAGLKPGGEHRGWFQDYPMESNRLLVDRARLTLRTRGGETPLAFFDDYLLGGYGGEGFALERGAVFAGYGIADEEAQVDDYAGLDVKDRFVVVLDGRPEERQDLRRAGSSRSKRLAAKAHGAAGLIVLTETDSGESRQLLGRMEDTVRNPSLSMPQGEREAAWPTIALRPEASRAFGTSVGLDLAAERAARAAGPVPGRALEGLEVALSAEVDAVRTHGSNILGLVPGSDPRLREEVVIVSAHNDHIGTLADGTVNNGADDNASGTTTLMVAAAALAGQAPPRRTLLFLSVSGEEKGLLGSEWWCNHPTVPLEQVVADINLDMVGRNDPDAVGATPSPAHADYNTLVERAVELGPAAGLRITWNAPAAGDDAVDNYYHRSDHYNFAARGIPVVFFFSGVHEDYHRPGDDVEKIDREKLRRMVTLVTSLVRDVADADERPHKLAEQPTAAPAVSG